MQTDSPGVPASASAIELFRGFSFIAPALLMDDDESNPVVPCGIQNQSNHNQVSSQKSTDSTKLNISRLKGRTLDEFEFHEVIGEGSFSVCQRCVHVQSKQEFAVKVSCCPSLFFEVYRFRVLA